MRSTNRNRSARAILSMATLGMLITSGCVSMPKTLTNNRPITPSSGLISSTTLTELGELRVRFTGKAARGNIIGIVIDGEQKARIWPAALLRKKSKDAASADLSELDTYKALGWGSRDALAADIAHVITGLLGANSPRQQTPQQRRRAQLAVVYNVNHTWTTWLSPGKHEVHLQIHFIKAQDGSVIRSSAIMMFPNTTIRKGRVSIITVDRLDAYKGGWGRTIYNKNTTVPWIE